MELKKQFDFINFFYGIGAAIILIAALFKFLGLQFADTLFMIGLIGEAIIFCISAFEWKHYKEEYKWHKIFPQLKSETDDGDDLNHEIELNEATQELQAKKILETLVSLHGSINNLNIATRKLNESVDKMDKNYDILSESTSQYQKELDLLKNKLANANSKLKDFDNFSINN